MFKVEERKRGKKKKIKGEREKGERSMVWVERR